MKSGMILFVAASLVCATLAMGGDRGFVREGGKRSITLPAAAVLLKEGPGMDTTGGNCGICHSLDYITTQPKFPKAKWQAEVTKMIKTYGAPISEENSRIIVDYITANYGNGR